MNRFARITEWLALLAPAALVLALVLRYGVNVPHWDQWATLHGLVEARVRGFPWTDVLAHHNEHRMIFPKLIMLGLAELTRWNIIAELLLNVALAAGSLLVVVALARPVVRTAGLATRLWAALTLSAILFSLTQWGNWLWGWQIQWFLATFAAVSAVAMATWSLRSPRPVRHVAGAIAAAVVCQFSLASGIAIWLSGALILVFHPRRRLVLSVWLAAAAVANVLYFAGYTVPGHHPSLSAGLKQPLAFLTYVGNYLAGPLGRHAIYGLLASVSFIALAVVAFARWRREPELVLPWIAIGVFAGANAAVTAIGRVGFGAAQGLESRYATLGLLLPVSLVPLGILALRAWPERRWAPARFAVGAVGAVLLTVLVVRADVFSRKPLVAESQKLASARDCLIAIDEARDECLEKLYRDAAAVRHWTKQLQAWGWSGFPKVASQPPGTIRITGPDGSRLRRLRLVEGPGYLERAAVADGVLTVSGWARRPRPPEGGRRVLVTRGDAVRGEAVLVGDTAVQSDLASERDAWSMRVEPFSATRWPVRLTAYHLLSDDALTPLDGGAAVEK
jgi:hypothetical protein